MIASSVTSLLSAAPSNLVAAAKSSPLVHDLGDFRKLLATQLGHQSSLDPTNLLLMQYLNQGANLIGKTVTYAQPGSAVPARGKVDAVKIDNHKLSLVVGGKTVALDQVRRVDP